MGFILAASPKADYGGIGAVGIVALFIVLFAYARIAYRLDLKRRRAMTPEERRAEKHNEGQG